MKLINLEKNEKVIIFHQKAGSTIDHFIRAPLEKIGAKIVELDSSKEPSDNDLQHILSSSFVIVVRYLTTEWINLFQQAKNVKFIYLMDDDLLDEKSLKILPTEYQNKIIKSVGFNIDLISSIFNEMWVTSEFLKTKYEGIGLPINLIPLCPHRSLLDIKPRIQLAYLGTSVHDKELIWLQGLVYDLQKRQENTYVEIFGNHQINKQFRDMPRTRIIHPMQWQKYLQETTYGRIDILLTPLLESPMNSARSPVKFIDAARCGAAGLYSDRIPYKGFIRNGVDGILLGDEYQDWIDSIENLINDHDKRKRLAKEALDRAVNLSLT